MNRYAYLILSLSLLLPALYLLYVQKDRAAKSLIIKIGLLGGVVGVVTEFFYFKDYWRPPTLLGPAKVSIEDFITGFALFVLSATAYPFLFKAHFKEAGHPRRMKVFVLFIGLGLTGMAIFNLCLHVNSIFVSSGIAVAFAVIIMTLRKDLIRSSMYSAIMLTLFTLIIYVIIFDFVAPHFWSNYWLLGNTKWGRTIIGNVPLTEMLCYFSIFLLNSTLYCFITGKELVRKRDTTA